MPKDTESLGNNKAPACESRGFVRKIMKVCILTHLLGISYFQGGDSFIKASNSNRGLFFPIEVNFLTSGNKHKLELGLGSNLGIYNEHISFIEESKEQYETISSTSNTTFGYYFFSNIGYRYISTKGFLFRIGLSPSFSFNDKHGITKEPFIYPYISFGYSF